jgi:hypothetical protein
MAAGVPYQQQQPIMALNPVYHHVPVPSYVHGYEHVRGQPQQAPPMTPVPVPAIVTTIPIPDPGSQMRTMMELSRRLHQRLGLLPPAGPGESGPQ